LCTEPLNKKQVKPDSRIPLTGILRTENFIHYFDHFNVAIEMGMGKGSKKKPMTKKEREEKRKKRKEKRAKK